MSYFFKDLVVWQEAKAFALEVYAISDEFPKQEIYGMTSQVRRAAVSVASNIAEGQGRLTRGEFIQFLGHARGSLLEAVTQLEIAAERKYLDQEQLRCLEQKGFQILRLLNALIDSLRSQRSHSAQAGA